MNTPISRRSALRQMAAGTVALSMAGLARSVEAAGQVPGVSGKIRHSVCKWCYPKVALDDLCRHGRDMGLASIDLVQPEDFPTLQKYGLVSAMVSFPTAKVGDVTVGSIPRAWNRLEYHDALVGIYEGHLRATAAAGFPNLICFSGNRDGMA
ncbi:MAG TPA: hypothetical protein VMH39_06740, partial [Gemmatimonadaceae bacterium]|nr:hypothetical protein [Gemmatimonadaceae bacterium]